MIYPGIINYLNKAGDQLIIYPLYKVQYSTVIKKIKDCYRREVNFYFIRFGVVVLGKGRGARRESLGGCRNHCLPTSVQYYSA